MTQSIFYCPLTILKIRFKKDKHVTMEHFYRAMRKRFDLLMEDDKPAGGKWNFDSNNRNKFSKQDLAIYPRA